MISPRLALIAASLLIPFSMSRGSAAENPSTIKATSPLRILACAAQAYIDVNSSNLIEAKYRHATNSARYQFNLSGAVGGYAVKKSDATAIETQTGGDLRLQKQLLDFSLNASIDAADKDLKSVEKSLRADLLEYLLALNQSLQTLATSSIDFETVTEQLADIEEIEKFSTKLMKNRVIDPSNSLLVTDNVLRFRLRKVELGQQIFSQTKSLESNTGLIVGSLETAAKPASVDSSLWDRLAASVERSPRKQAAQLKASSLETTANAAERSWYPRLSSELTYTQPNSIGVNAQNSQLSLGLVLSFSFADRTVSADIERSRLLGQVEVERSRRAEIEFTNRIQQAKNQWVSLQKQQQLNEERLQNLERLRKLQLLKFREGRTSFLLLNEVMLTLFDVRRELRAVVAQREKLERDAMVFAQLTELSDDLQRECRPLSEMKPAPRRSGKKR